MAVAIPKVQVPMNFGVQYLGSPLHSNLKFRVKDDKELLANSIIISFNSPVIEDLVTNLFQSVIEVEEYSKDVVQCFLEATYSGEVKNITKANFRDINKMGHVFEVSWIVDWCYDYFKSLLRAVESVDYDNQLFLFEEAMFVLTKLKKKNYVDLVINSFTTLVCCTKDFVTKYLSDLSVCSTIVLDVIIEMVGKEQEDILIGVLVNHLEERKCVVDDKTRHVLRGISFKLCKPSQEVVYRKLIGLLECVDNPTKDDYKILAGLLKQYNQALFSEKTVAMPQVSLPNLFHSLKPLSDINDPDSLLHFLKHSKIVANGYIFHDAISSWLFDKRSDESFPYSDLPDYFFDEFQRIVIKREWSPLALEYTEFCKRKSYGNLAPQTGKNENLVSQAQYKRVTSVEDYFPDDFFGKDHDIKFRFKSESYNDCSNDGECGFILRVSAASGEEDNSFDVQLVINNDLYPKDIHFHSEISSIIDTCHFALDVLTDPGLNHFNDIPVTWYGKPCLDGSKKFWCWGAYLFYDKDEKGKSSGVINKWFWFLGSRAKIRPVVYFFPKQT